MRFLVTSGGQLKGRLRDFPSYYADIFSSPHTSIVTYLTDNNDVIAACGIQSPFNYILFYVKEGYRGRGLGTQVMKKTIHVARRRNLNFIGLAVSLENEPSLRVISKFGFKETVTFPKFNFKLMMLPLKIEGEIVYTFLHGFLSKIPETLLERVVVFLMGVSKRFRQLTATGTT